MIWIKKPADVPKALRQLTHPDRAWRKLINRVEAAGCSWVPTKRPPGDQTGGPGLKRADE